MPKYLIADFIIEIEPKFDYLKKLCEPFLLLPVMDGCGVVPPYQGKYDELRIPFLMLTALSAATYKKKKLLK